MKKAISFTLAALAASLSVGCASVVVTQNNLEQNTSLALGLEVSEFTISDRVDSGYKTTYRVKTNSGRKFSCYIMGAMTMSFAGNAVSDAMCTEIGTPQAATQTNSTKTSTGKGKAASGSCNDLLRAAGRCS